MSDKNRNYKWKLIFTVRKRSLRRLCFYTCLWFCSQGGLPHCMLGYPLKYLHRIFRKRNRHHFFHTKFIMCILHEASRRTEYYNINILYKASHWLQLFFKHDWSFRSWTLCHVVMLFPFQIFTPFLLKVTEKFKRKRRNVQVMLNIIISPDESF